MSLFGFTHAHSVNFGLSNILFLYLKNYRGDRKKMISVSESASKNTLKKLNRTIFMKTQVIP